MGLSAPTASSPSVSARMSRQRRRDTAVELELRKALHALGCRYRVAYPVPGLPRRTIDIAFTRRRVAVSALGCFWHGCPEHGTSPKANSAWWAQKISRNRARDDETRQHLDSLGWLVAEVWEHDSVAIAVDRVQTALRARD